MTDNVLANMDRIRELRGLPAIDSTRIEGDGPSPNYFEDDPPFPAVEPHPIPEFEIPETEEPSSPLVSLGSQAPPVAQAPIPDGLVIINEAASYEGQAVILSEMEQAAISSIVLKALANRIKAQHAQIMARLPKQVRVRRSSVGAAIVSSDPVIKRKRGRPRKEKDVPGTESGGN